MKNVRANVGGVNYISKQRFIAKGTLGRVWTPISTIIGDQTKKFIHKDDGIVYLSHRCGFVREIKIKIAKIESCVVFKNIFTWSTSLSKKNYS